jgi:GldM N-terminal domain
MYFRFQIAFASLLSIALLSCDNGSKTDREIIKAMEESLNRSNKTISFSTEKALVSLEDKLYDWASRERASVWLPKTRKIHDISNDCYSYIEKLKEGEKISAENAAILFKKLSQYKSDILNIDYKIRELFGDTSISTNVNSFNIPEARVFDAFIQKSSTKSKYAFLTQLQNDVKNFENRTILFCNEQVGSISDGFETFSAIINQSSNIVEPGKEIEIKAGIGSFSKMMMPSIIINEKEIPLDDSAVSKYKIKTPDKPGNYSVPIKISYTDQDGKKQFIESRIKYTVAKICNE